MQIINNLLTPTKFLKIANYISYPAGFFSFLLIIAGLYYALIASPADYQQGEAVRIMYLHVPSATMALGIYLFMAVFALSGLVWQNPLSFVILTSAAPIGAIFNLICLITGAIWGKPIWGTWWVWDARITSMFLLFLLYIGNIVLYQAHEDKNKGAKFAAIIALIGVVNLPIIKFSVNWWNTLHQPASIIRKGGISIDPTMQTPLFLMFLGFICLFIFLLFLSIKTQLLAKKLERIEKY